MASPPPAQQLGVESWPNWCGPGLLLHRLHSRLWVFWVAVQGGEGVARISMGFSGSGLKALEMEFVLGLKCLLFLCDSLTTVSLAAFR